MNENINILKDGKNEDYNIEHQEIIDYTNFINIIEMKYVL